MPAVLKDNETVTKRTFKKRVLTVGQVCRIVVELEGSGVFLIEANDSFVVRPVH